jgi:hypothetical protein
MLERFYKKLRRARIHHRLDRFRRQPKLTVDLGPVREIVGQLQEVSMVFYPANGGGLEQFTATFAMNCSGDANPRLWLPNEIAGALYGR